MDILHLKRLEKIKSLAKNIKEEPVPVFRSANEWNQNPGFSYPVLYDHHDPNFIYIDASGSYYENPVRYYDGEPEIERGIFKGIERLECDYCGQKFYLNVKEMKTLIFVLSCPFCGGRI